LISWLAQAQPVEFGETAMFKVIATDSNGFSTPQDAGDCLRPSRQLGDEQGRAAQCALPTQPVFGLMLDKPYIRSSPRKPFLKGYPLPMA
jgi:hypothetical protein